MGNAIKQLAAKGVTILVGSDASNLTSFQGFSFHRELELLVKAGVSPWQVLKGASLDAQKFMGLDWQIVVGHQAEFVVFNQSPVPDISRTQSIYTMVHKGQVVNRQALLNNATPTGWAKLKMYLYLQ
jgi:imidazolonepropionase-like amidohydrolase